MVSLFCHFGVNHLVNVLHKLVALSFVVLGLSLPNVNQVHEALLFHGSRLTNCSDRRFRVLNQTSAERLQAVVEVPHREHDSGARGERFDLGAPVLESCEELLHKRDLGNDVKVRVLVHRVEECAGKLLLGVDESVKLSLSDSEFKAAKQPCMLLL